VQLFNTKKLQELRAKENTLKKHTILIVDDEISNRKVITSILKSNFTLLEAESAAQALAIVENHPNPASISMVISDQRMPKMNGVELLTKFASIIPKSVRIIVSGFTDVEAFIESINKANIYKFILKPFERTDFLWTVERAIENLELQQKLDQHLESLEQTVTDRTQELASNNLELEKTYSKLEDIGLTDPLTQLKNRRFLVTHLDSDIAQSLRAYQDWNKQNRSEELANTTMPNSADLLFFLLDLDHFKLVNDNHGHEAGDLVLKDIKGILLQVFRSSDYLMRWGGGEFLVIARNSNRSDVALLAERLRFAVAQHTFAIGNAQIITKTCSIGCAAYPFNPHFPEQLDWQQVVNITDKALYLAKKNGRNGWVGAAISRASKDEYVQVNTSALKKSGLLNNSNIELDSNLKLING
jgi:diguanylate cyclase (GGDEF)-like protein